MKRAQMFTAIATLAAMSAVAHADIALDVIGGSEVSLEGLIQAEGDWFNNDVLDLNGPSSPPATPGPANNDGKDTEFEMRRAEIILKGKGTTFDWVMGYDAKANKWLDANVRWKLGNSYLAAGQYKQPNSLEELSSTRHNDFISKAMVTNLFGVARRVGVVWADDEPNWGYAVSAFTRELTRNLGEGNGYGARGYWAPINHSGNWLHLGASLVDYGTHENMLRLRVRPDADLATQRLVDTGNFTDATRQRTYGLEGAWVGGAFKVQSEYMSSHVSRDLHDSFDGDSWYVSGVWNITGETWGYKSGLPTTPLPNEPASGMWQVGVRYDNTDLNDGFIAVPTTPTGFPTASGVLGGKESNWTFGVNWYWHSNFKVAANYVMVTSERFNTTTHSVVDDNPDIFEVRLQLYW